MISIKPYFSLSEPLIRENFKRFWAIPVIGFLVYFLSFTFPIIISYRKLPELTHYINYGLDNLNVFFMIAHLLIPITTAVLLFRYLQTDSAATTMHSLPFTRAKIYNSNIVSGFIMVTLPIIANALILLTIAKPVFSHYMDVNNIMIPAADSVDVFSRLHVLEWAGQSIVILLFVFMVSVLAGILCGNTIMHIFTALWFNFLLPALAGIIILYSSIFFKGFQIDSSSLQTIMQLSPYTQVLNNEQPIWLYMIYLFAILFFIILASVLYHKRKLEKATNSIAFDLMIPITNYLIAFFGMTFFGFFLIICTGADMVYPEGVKWYSCIGFIIGGFISFFLGRMIVMKTRRVFDKQSWKSFCIYVIISLVFMSLFLLDF